MHIDPAENADRLLGELLTLGREVDVDVDVVGYGRGGLVARELAARTTDGPLKVGAFATIGTPHRGTPLADAGGILAWVNRTTSLAALAPDPLSDLLTALAALVAQVVEGSIDGLRGFTALGAGPSAYLASLAEQPTATARSLFIAGAHDLDPTGGAWKAITRWAADAALDGRPNDLFVSVDSALAQSDDEARVAGRPTESLTVVGTHGSYLAVPAVERALHGWFVDGTLARPEPEVAVPATASVFSEARPERPVRVALPPDGTSVAEDERSRRQHDRSRRGAQSSPTLHVRLLHSSLEHAEFPVLVGHFAGSPLSGAEERLDDCLENKLSRAQVARDYPEALGEFRHFPGYEGTPPPGAIVVGLGPMGELTESQLTAVVTRSLVRYASERRDRERAVVRSGQDQDDCGDAALGVASVLIGTSLSSGLSVESSVRAIVAGVVAANLRLGQASSAAGVDPSGDRAPIAFTELRFVARHEDMVELAARALQQLGDETSPNQDSYPVLYVPQPKIGEGAAGPNPPDDTANDVWARLRIESRDGREDGLRELTYGVMARLARADEITHAVDPALVDDLIAKSINRRSDARIGATLYELLVPHELKQPLGSGSHLHLLLDEHTADLPWELLTPRGDAFRDSRPVALGGGVLRQFVEGKDRRAAPERAPERTVLVIGNPPPGPGFGSLHGAVDEAREVVRAFESARSAARWQITARIWDTRERYVGSTLDGAHTTDPAENVIHELMTGSWRVVHIAAHGAIDPAGNAALSGVVLGPGERLTPATAGQLNIVPDLVVLNACHLGAIERQLAGMNHVAASLARRLMQIGVRAVIAAGWAVGDMAAAVFAEGLYGSLLAGRELGDAVLEARSRVHAELPTTLTWGAYQCYGDPGFRLAPRQQPHSSGALGALTVSELRRRIRATTGLVSDRTSSLSALRRDIEEVRLLADEAAGDERTSSRSCTCSSRTSSTPRLPLRCGPTSTPTSRRRGPSSASSRSRSSGSDPPSAVAARMFPSSPSSSW